MNGAVLVVWLAACVAGIVLSLRSVSVLRVHNPDGRAQTRSSFTIAGWLATAAYFALAGYDAARSQHAPWHADYVVLGALAVAFAVAGFRDEPQAEPWYWPVRAGQTGRERRARGR
jgi:hypothetical protein